MREAVDFTMSRIVTLFLDMFVMWLLPSIFHINDWIATFVSAVLVVVMNYIIFFILSFLSLYLCRSQRCHRAVRRGSRQLSYRLVAVVGGGNTALEDAAFLSNYCEQVYVIHRRETVRGGGKLVKGMRGTI